MINITTLKESIYKEEYFSVANGSLTIQNEKNSAPDVLSFVELFTKGTFINLDNRLLQEGSNIFHGEDRNHGRISFRRDCDGICLLEVDGRQLLLVIEVKSGFNEVKKKAFEQLVASYVKARTILQSIDGFVPSDYEELGLLFSYPPSGTATISTSEMLSVKAATITPSVLDKLNSKNATALSVNQEVLLNLTDYNIDACHVNSALYCPTLHVKHIPITDSAVSEKVDLDKYL